MIYFFTERLQAQKKAQHKKVPHARYESGMWDIFVSSGSAFEFVDGTLILQEFECPRPFPNAPFQRNQEVDCLLFRYLHLDYVGRVRGLFAPDCYQYTFLTTNLDRHDGVLAPAPHVHRVSTHLIFFQCGSAQEEVDDDRNCKHKNGKGHCCLGTHLFSFFKMQTTQKSPAHAYRIHKRVVVY